MCRWGSVGVWEGEVDKVFIFFGGCGLRVFDFWVGLECWVLM